MTAQTATIADFILARIEEDEDRARRWVEVYVDPKRGAVRA